MAKYRPRIDVGCRWEIEADTSTRARHTRTNREYWPSQESWEAGRRDFDDRRRDVAHGPVSPWVPIECARTRQGAKILASAWRESTGQRTRIVPGRGHRTRRA